MNIVELLKQGAADRRAHYRVSRHLATQGVLCDGKKIGQEFQITDVGPGGLRIEGAGVFTKGQSIQLMASGVEVKVVWARKKKNSQRFECGTQFVVDTTKQAEAVTKFLLEDCYVGIMSPHEKRKYMRVPVPDHVSGRLSLANGAEVPVRVRDLAVSGALLVSPRGLSTGTEVQARIDLLPQQPPLECTAEVVHQNPYRRSTDHELGLQFTRVADNHQEQLKRFLVRILLLQSQ